MQIDFRFNNLNSLSDLTPKLTGFFKLFYKFTTTFASEFRRVVINISRQSGQYHVKANMQLPGKNLSVTQTGKNLIKTLVKVRDVLIRQIKHYKTR